MSALRKLRTSAAAADDASDIEDQELLGIAGSRVRRGNNNGSRPSATSALDVESMIINYDADSENQQQSPLTAEHMAPPPRVQIVKVTIAQLEGDDAMPPTLFGHVPESPTSSAQRGSFVKRPFGSRTTYVCKSDEWYFCLCKAICCPNEEYFMCQRDTPATQFCLTLAFIVPVSVFCIVVCPEGDMIRRAVAVIFCALSLTCLYWSGMIDPGIVLPAREHDPPVTQMQVEIVDEDTAAAAAIENGNDKTNEGEAAHAAAAVTAIRQPPPSFPPHRELLEVCPVCRVVRPPRSAHMSVRGTDFCVSASDHYCGVTAVAVAARSFRFFTLFMYTTASLAIFIFVNCVLVIVSNWPGSGGKLELGSNLETLLRKTVTPLVLCMITLYVAVFVTIVGVKYTYLSCAGRTIKDLKGRQHFLPTATEFTCTNWWRRLFGPMPPSAFKPGINYSDFRNV